MVNWSLQESVLFWVILVMGKSKGKNPQEKSLPLMTAVCKCKYVKNKNKKAAQLASVYIYSSWGRSIDLTAQRNSSLKRSAGLRRRGDLREL